LHEPSQFAKGKEGRKSTIEKTSNPGLSINGLGGKNEWDLNVKELNFSHRSKSSKSHESMVYDLISQ
jgi:hypothetical protein